MDDTKVIDLATPIELHGQTYDKISLREPTVGEVDKAFKGTSGLAGTILLISLISDIPRGAIEKLPMRPFKEAAAFISVFTEDSPETTAS